MEILGPAGHPRPWAFLGQAQGCTQDWGPHVKMGEGVYILWWLFWGTPYKHWNFKHWPFRSSFCFCHQEGVYTCNKFRSHWSAFPWRKKLFTSSSSPTFSKNRYLWDFVGYSPGGFFICLVFPLSPLPLSPVYACLLWFYKNKIPCFIKMEFLYLYCSVTFNSQLPIIMVIFSSLYVQGNVPCYFWQLYPMVWLHFQFISHSELADTQVPISGRCPDCCSSRGWAHLGTFTWDFLWYRYQEVGPLAEIVCI